MPVFESELRASVRETYKAANASEPELTHVAFESWARTMSRGRFEQGWQMNDRSGRHWPSAHRLWDGRSIQNLNLCVRSLHGLGDAVQMLRYAPQLRQLVRSVRFEVPKALEPLMPYFDGVSESPIRHGSCDAEIEMMELPYLFRTLPSDLPLRTRYLVLPDRIAERCKSSMGLANKPRIGVIWSGGQWDRERWIPFELLRRLTDNQRFDWWNLQGGAYSAEAASSPLRTTFDLRVGGLTGLAATVANLDLVLSVDTLAAHIAGALGVPTWLMLKREGDWRWMIERCDSPWYPSLRVFRQAVPRCWSAVIEEVREALARWE